MMKDNSFSRRTFCMESSLMMKMIKGGIIIMKIWVMKILICRHNLTILAFLVILWLIRYISLDFYLYVFCYWIIFLILSSFSRTQWFVKMDLMCEKGTWVWIHCTFLQVWFYYASIVLSSFNFLLYNEIMISLCIFFLHQDALQNRDSLHSIVHNFPTLIMLWNHNSIMLFGDG